MKQNGLKEIGLARFTTKGKQPQRMTIPLDWLDDVKIGEAPDSDSEFGPDLAFVRLPDQVAASMKTTFSFLNQLQEAKLSELARSSWH